MALFCYDGQMKSIKNIDKRLLVGSIFGALAIIAVLVYLIRIEPKQKINDWESFKSSANSLTMPDTKPIYINSLTTGCFKDDAGYGSIQTCTFSSKQFYKFGGSYRDEAQEVKAYILKQGFDFKSDNSKQLFESHINNKNVADDLSNGTPLVADFINKQSDIELRVSIGDKKRLNPQGPIGLTPELFDILPDEQLMTILSFSREYK